MSNRKGTHTATPATPEQVARFGHVAAFLRQELGKRGWTPSDLNIQLGKGRSYSSAYQWINGKAVPGPSQRPLLAKLLGCSEAQLMAVEPGAAPPRQEVVVAQASGAPKVGRPPGATRAAPVLGFAVDTAGMAHITLDVKLPLVRAMPLFRLLMDAHVVDGEEADG